VVYDVLGEGPEVLCLPAFSTVSSRQEMRALAERIAEGFRVVLLDWPGFGESTRARFLYRPDLYRRFLADMLESSPRSTHAVVAAGHAAGYALALAARRRPPWSKMVLVAPTWRGPLPTVLGSNPAAYRALEAVVRAPVVGHALYRASTTAKRIEWMLREHVYADPGYVTETVVREKQSVARKLGGRYAPVAFVTGALDLFRTRDEMLATLRPPPVPVLVVVGDETPEGSRAEMQAIADEPDVRARRIPGSLLPHEEYPDAAAAAIVPFLHEGRR
jgi:pimeloyl-ACP methyl ester carboxylesterase